MDEDPHKESGADVMSGDLSGAETADMHDTDEEPKPSDEHCAGEGEGDGRVEGEGREGGVDIQVEGEGGVDIEEGGGEGQVEGEGGVDIDVEGEGREGGVDIDIEGGGEEGGEGEGREGEGREGGGDIEGGGEEGGEGEGRGGGDIEGGGEECESHVEEVLLEDEQKLLQELQTEHITLTRLNLRLQTKLAEHFLYKLVSKPRSAREKTRTYADILEDVKKQMQEKKKVEDLIEALSLENTEKMESYEYEMSLLASVKRDVMVANLEPASGRTEAQAVSERLLMAERKCREELASVREETVKLSLKIAELEAGLRAQEDDLDGDVQSIDFEQLKMENQAYSEKVQESTQELCKLRTMLPQTGHILMHVKEKLSFFRGDNHSKQEHFDALDAVVQNEQAALTQTMQARDVLRFDNLRKRQQGGLLGNPVLLRDFEDTEDEREALRKQLERLKKSGRHTV